MKASRILAHSNTVEIEVMSQHYMGSLLIEPASANHSMFAVFLGGKLLGRVQPFKRQQETLWYSHEITDNELLNQIGEWISHHYILTDRSIKRKRKQNWIMSLITLF